MWSVLISVCYRDSNSYICWASPWLYELSKCTNKCAWEIPYKEWAKELWDHTATRKSPKPTCCSLWVALCCQGLWAATSVQSLPLSVQPLVCKPPCAATSVQGPVFVFPKLRFSPSCSLTRLFVHSVYTHLLKARYGTGTHFLPPSVSRTDCWITPQIGYDFLPLPLFHGGRIFLFQLGNLMSESSVWQSLSSTETPCLLISSSAHFHMSKHFNGIWFQGGRLQMREN